MSTAQTTRMAAPDNEVEHPLATLTGVHKIVGALPVADSVRAVQESVQWLESLHGVAYFSVAHRYEVIER